MQEGHAEWPRWAASVQRGVQLDGPGHDDHHEDYAMTETTLPLIPLDFLGYAESSTTLPLHVLPPAMHAQAADEEDEDELDEDDDLDEDDEDDDEEDEEDDDEEDLRAGWRRVW